MANEGNCAKTCTFICFNIFYLLCAAVYIFRLISGYIIKASSEYEFPPSFGTRLTILSFVVISMIFVAIFGFVAYCVDKSALYIAYAVMLLVCMGLQTASGVYSDKAAFDLIEYQLKSFLPNFTLLPSELQRPIQEKQQENDCCAYDSYKEYYNPLSSDLEQNWRIPDSCCGKYYRTKYSWETGACSFEEYSKKKGCGTLLRDAFFEYVNELSPGSDVRRTIKVSWIFFIIFCVIQVFSVLSAFYAFLRTRAQASNTGMVYGGAATTYR